MKNTITFNEFVTLENSRLERFHKYWKEHHEKDPENFPLNMGLPDWIEQYNMYVDEQDK